MSMDDALCARIDELVAERDACELLLYEVLVGMRNSPVRRATEMLTAKGRKIIDDDPVTYEVMREQRDDARSALDREQRAAARRIADILDENQRLERKVIGVAAALAVEAGVDVVLGTNRLSEEVNPATTKELPDAGGHPTQAIPQVQDSDSEG